MRLQFTVYGVAQPKGNMKAFQGRGMKAPIITESNRGVKSWSQLVADGASRAIAELPDGERGQLRGGVRLSMAFYLPRPKQYDRKPDAAHLTAPDWDKLARAVGDALTGVAYLDDKQVCEGVIGKYYAAINDVPHVDIVVEPTQGLAHRLVVPPVGLPLFGAIA